jgi:glycosyltransferase involved in cell wall biosynthesis
VGAVHGVLVTYRRPEHVRAYLDRLADQTRTVDSLIIIDNDPAESARVVAERPALPVGVEYLPAGDNLGPAGGIALGMQRVLEHAAPDDWILLCDDDDPPRTRELIEVLHEFGESLRGADARVGGVGLAGGRFDLSHGRVVHVEDEELAGPLPACEVAGNQLPIYSVHAVKEVGLFEARLFFGFEELEYGLRMLDGGFRIYAHGDLWLRERTHYGRLNRVPLPGRRLEGVAGWRRYYSLRNMIYILRSQDRHFAALRVALIGIAKPVYNLPRTPRLAVRHLRLNSRAVLDAYRGRMGRTVEPVAKW